MSSVLIAEADRCARAVYRWYLEREGFRVETAEGGIDCLAALRRRVPELLILDMGLAWGGGDGVLRVLREDPRLCPDRVLLLTAEASPRSLNPLDLPPGVSILTKPFPLYSLTDLGPSVGPVADLRGRRTNGGPRPRPRDEAMADRGESRPRQGVP